MASLAFGRHKVSTSSQAIVSRPNVPRSTFQTSSTHKTTFDSDYLYPVYLEEIIPGDSLSVDVTAFVRMATPVFPVMDNLFVDMFFFFIPNRLVWRNWVKFMGETRDPDDETAYLVPTIPFDDVDPPGEGSLYDYLGIPPLALGIGEQFSINALPVRAYELVWNEWFRDQNLQDSRGESATWDGDGPDHPSDYVLLKRGKRHDYFTSSLPWPQKGNSVTLPLSGTAPVIPVGTGGGASGFAPTFLSEGGGSSQLIETVSNNVQLQGLSSDGILRWGSLTALEADLNEVLAVSINTMRAGVAMQQLLEMNGRYGTRYVETLKGHFGVDPQDSRLQRPEYLGGSSTPISVTPVAQTGPPTAEGDTPIGNLGAAAVATPRAKISSTFPEHGYVMGLVNVRADLSYQQGLHRMWTRETKYDFPWPVFANLGEQSVLQREIFLSGVLEDDQTVFGYQERYAEYRYRQSLITGQFRSGISGTMDSWHLAQFFASAPTLDVEGSFIESDTPMARVLSAGELAEGQQFFADILFNQRFTRPLPMRGTPGLVRF